MKEIIAERYQTAFAGLFSASQTKKLLTRMERVSSNIAPLNSVTGNTHTITRWNLPTDNSHYATEEECENIFVVLVEDLLGLLGVEGYTCREILNIFGN